MKKEELLGNTLSLIANLSQICADAAENELNENDMHSEIMNELEEYQNNITQENEEEE